VTPLGVVTSSRDLLDMHGPPLTPHEAVASVERRVCRCEAQGLDHVQAVRQTSVETGVEPDKVRWCAPARRSTATIRRRRTLGIAAVL
jgi:hypothetical protein